MGEIVKFKSVEDKDKEAIKKVLCEAVDAGSWILAITHVFDGEDSHTKVVCSFNPREYKAFTRGLVEEARLALDRDL